MHRILQYDSSTPTRIDTLLGVQRARMPTSRSTHVYIMCMYDVCAYYTVHRVCILHTCTSSYA